MEKKLTNPQISAGSHVCLGEKQNVDVVSYDVEISFLDHLGQVAVRSAKLFSPDRRSGAKRPLVIAVHYEMKPDDPALAKFISQGWCVLTPVQLEECDVSNIVDADLRFNMALLCAAKNIDGIDRLRIALRGGSAGGYQTLMLCALGFGINCGYAICGVMNMAYQFQYLIQNNKLNQEAEKIIEIEKKDDFNSYPIPMVKAIHDGFMPTGVALGLDDIEGDKWYSFSPISHLEEISSPMLLSHSTADIVVPIFQVSEKHAPREFSADLPPTFKMHLIDIVSTERFRKPVDEILAHRMYTYIRCPESDPDRCLSFTPDFRFNLNIIDEGMIEKSCTHLKKDKNADYDETDFLRFYLHQPYSDTQFLNLEKLKVLAVRFNATHSMFSENIHKRNCKQNIYGSLAAERLDVLQSLADYLAPEGRERKAAIASFCELYHKLEKTEKFLGEIEPSSLMDQVHKSKMVYKSVFNNSGSCQEVLPIEQ